MSVKETPFSTYALKYELKAVPGKFPVEKIQDGKRPSDALLLGTFRWHGSRVDADFTSIDGRKTVTSKGGVPTPMSDFDLFQAWLTLGMSLLESQLEPRLKKIVRLPYEEIEKDVPLGMQSGPESTSGSIINPSDDCEEHA